jgi:hypothetical protein
MTEARYIAASEAAKEVVWIRNFISKLGVVPSAQVKEARAHKKAKHLL